MISAIKHLSDKEIKAFYRQLSIRLLEVFGEDAYNDTEELQESFQDWKLSDIKDFRETLDDILEDISPESVPLTWRDLKKLHRNRWKLCACCGSPFIAIGVKNKMKCCYYKEYKRYRMSSGEFFKLTEEGASECLVKYTNARKQKKLYLFQNL
jgi:hypothetical protein